MTSRERLQGFFEKKEIDRLPCIEWATWWDLTLKRWAEEGHDIKLDNLSRKTNFGLDYDNQIWFSNQVKGHPKFKEQGIISTEEEYQKLKPFLFQKEMIYNFKNMLEDVHKNVEEKGHITWITLNGFFWYPRVLFGIEDHLYSFYDFPELYHQICKDMVEYYTFLIEEITKYISPQFVTLAEDMSYNLGPMLSKDTFDTFLKPYYEQIIPLFKSKGIKVIVDSDGDITKLAPWLIEAGVEGILPLERQAGVDVNELTKLYPDFIFIGGFDKMVMGDGEQAMRDEFERILPAMKRGNYIPSVDHQTPPNVSLDNYIIYTRLLKEYCQKAVL